jgi:hypothetical protein
MDTTENCIREKSFFQLFFDSKYITFSKLFIMSILILQVFFALTYNLNRLNFLSIPDLKFFNLSSYTYAWGMYSVIPNYTTNVTIEFKNESPLLIDSVSIIGKVSGNMMFSNSERLKLCSIYADATAVIYSMEPLENRLTLCP